MYFSSSLKLVIPIRKKKIEVWRESEKETDA